MEISYKKSRQVSRNITALMTFSTFSSPFSGTFVFLCRDNKTSHNSRSCYGIFNSWTFSFLSELCSYTKQANFVQTEPHSGLNSDAHCFSCALGVWRSLMHVMSELPIERVSARAEVSERCIFYNCKCYLKRAGKELMGASGYGLTIYLYG